MTTPTEPLRLDEVARRERIVEDENLNPWKRALIEYHITNFSSGEEIYTDAEKSLAVALRQAAEEALDPAISEPAARLRDDAAELRTALERLERAATVLSNHDRIKQPIRSAGDWSRLHSAIRGARAALAASEGQL